jgi:hypothetical protein
MFSLNAIDSMLKEKRAKKKIIKIGKAEELLGPLSGSLTPLEVPLVINK